MAASQVMRITLKAYDHQLIDASAKSIIETVKKTGSKVSGPVPMPTKKEIITILRATFWYKESGFELVKTLYKGKLNEGKLKKLKKLLEEIDD